MKPELDERDRHLIRQSRDTSLPIQRAIFFLTLGIAATVVLILGRTHTLSAEVVFWVTAGYVLITCLFQISASLLLGHYKRLIAKLANGHPRGGV